MNQSRNREERKVLMMNKKILAVSLMTLLAVTTASSSVAFGGTFERNNTPITINGNKLEPENAVNINGSIYVPLRKSFEMMGKEVIWHRELNEIIVEESKIPDPSTAAFQSNFHLIGAIPAEDILVYGLQPRGIIVYYKGDASYVDTTYYTPRMIMPKIDYGDYNGDGKKEVALSLYTMSGTGVGIEELHILTVAQSTDQHYVLSDHKFLTEAIETQLKENLSYQYDHASKKIQLNISGKIVEFTNPGGENSDTALTDLQYGNLIEFEISNSMLTVKIPVAALPHQNYFGTITAKVSFQNNQFHLSDYDFI